LIFLANILYIIVYKCVMALDLSVIKTLCKQKKVTSKEFCREIGVTESGLSHAIKNNRTTSDFLEKAAKYFGVSVDTFFGKQDTAIELLRKILDALIAKEKQSELIESYNYIENMMQSINYDDKNEIFELLIRRFNKIESYSILHYLETISINDINILCNYMEIENAKVILRLTIYRIVYKRDGIEHFAEFWFKYHNEPNRLKTL